MIRLPAALVAGAIVVTAGAVQAPPQDRGGPAEYVRVLPQRAALFAGAQLHLQASTVGASAPTGAIAWQVFGQGSVDANGTYQAPQSIGADAVVVATTGTVAGASRLMIVPAPPARTPLAIVACYGDGALDVRNPGRDGDLGRLAAGDSVGGIAVSTGGSQAIVTDAGHVASVELSTMITRPSQSIDGARFSEAAPLRDGLIAVTNANAGPRDNGVYVFRANPGEAPSLVTSAAAGDTPEGLAVSADGSELYVTAVNSNSLTRFEVLADGTLRKTGWARTGTRPFGVALASRRDLALVADNDTPTLSGRASRPGLEFFALPSMRRIGEPIPTGSSNALPLGIAVDEYEDRAFVTNEGDDDVAVFSLTTRTRQATLSVGRTPWLPAVDSLRHFLYVPDARDDTLEVFDTQTLRHVAAAVETCNYPIGVGVAR